MKTVSLVSEAPFSFLPTSAHSSKPTSAHSSKRSGQCSRPGLPGSAHTPLSRHPNKRLWQRYGNLPTQQDCWLLKHTIGTESSSALHANSPCQARSRVGAREQWFSKTLSVPVISPAARAFSEGARTVPDRTGTLVRGRGGDLHCQLLSVMNRLPRAGLQRALPEATVRPGLSGF